MTSVPEFLDPYRIVKPLGEGGMGRVFLAERMRDFAQQAVVKFGDAAEGNLLGQLRHENIVQLLGYGASEYGDYLVLEYVDGVTIDVFCRMNACSLDQRLDLLEQVLSAVGYAHRHLIIHADLKPSNVLVANGRVKVLDFGIAQTAGAQRMAHYTPLYASPEQREGKALSAATDVFLLGKMAAELVKEWLRGDLAAIVERATALHPEERYVSVEAMRDDIVRLRQGEPVSVRAPGWMEQTWRWMRRKPLAAAALVVLGLIVLGGAWEIVVHHARAVDERQLADHQLQELVRLNGVLAGELYEAMGTLQGGADARAKLRDAALSTLDAIAPDAKSQAFRVELARQYKRVAELQLADRLKSDAARTAARGLHVLAGNDATVGAELKQLISQQAQPGTN